MKKTKDMALMKLVSWQRFQLQESKGLSPAAKEMHFSSLIRRRSEQKGLLKFVEQMKSCLR